LTPGAVTGVASGAAAAAGGCTGVIAATSWTPQKVQNRVPGA
jgi:hypothetical protein